MFLDWTLKNIMYVEININKFNSFGEYLYIKLLKFIEYEKVNVQNQDECCFLWAIVSALFTVGGRTLNISSYPHNSTVFDTTGIDFSVKFRDTPKFELKNNISINVYGLEKKYQNDISYLGAIILFITDSCKFTTTNQ